MREQQIQSHYQRTFEVTQALLPEIPAYCHEMSKQFHGGLWRDYLNLINNIGEPLEGKTVVDFGCKFGHLAPLVKALGAAKYIGIDAELEYLDAGRRVFCEIYPESEFVQSHEGYIDLQPESADVIIMNEVISHINPTFLDVVWRESARILTRNGVLFISDGNNSANPVAAKKLFILYDQWENGPEGTQTDRDVVVDPFNELRRKQIASYGHPFSDETLDMLVQNTSGLFGVALRNEVETYARTGKLIRRPYVPGQVPVNPAESGVVMERGFHPVWLEMALAEYGYEAHQIVQKPYMGRSGLPGKVKDFLVWLGYKAQSIANPQWYRSAHEGFQLKAFKRSRTS